MFIDHSSSLESRFQTKLGQVYTRFQTKTVQKPYPLKRHIPIWLKEYPPPPTGEWESGKGTCFPSSAPPPSHISSPKGSQRSNAAKGTLIMTRTRNPAARPAQGSIPPGLLLDSPSPVLSLLSSSTFPLITSQGRQRSKAAKGT